MKLSELGLKLNAAKTQAQLVSTKHDKRDLKKVLVDLEVAGEHILKLWIKSNTWESYWTKT